MPTYTSFCHHCDTEIDYVRRIADRDDTPLCCGESTQRVFTAAMVPQMGIADHYKIVSGTGKTFYGRHEYDKYLKSNGLRPASDLKGEAEYQREQNEVKAKQARRKELETIVRQHT